MWLSAGPPPNSTERRNRSTAKEKTTKQPPERRNKSTAKEKTTKAAANAEIASKGNTTKQPPNKSTSTAKEKPPSRDATVVFEKETAQQPLYVLLLDAVECLTNVVENVSNVLNAH